MMRTAWVLMALGCVPPPHTEESASSVAPVPTTQHADACRDDIPDCAAACALRETSRREFIDFYDRRCATVILGKNPDKVPPPVVATASATTPSATPPADFPPDVRASLMVSHPPFDPTSVTRTGGTDPAECKAARILRAQHREHDADMLDAMCTAKGGEPGK